MLHKTYKFMVVFIVMILALGLTLPACTFQKPAETETPPTPPAPQGGAALSFEAAEYVNKDYGFSVKYPKEWLQRPNEEPTTVFYAASEKRVPALSISVLDGATFAEAITNVLSKAGSDIRIVTDNETTLANGKKASQAVVKWKTQGFGADTFAIGVKKGDKWIIVAITTVSLLAKYDEALFSEVTYTLQVK